MKELRERMIKFVENTIEYYKTNPRGLISKDSVTCQYFPADEKSTKGMCAVGRHFEDKHRKAFGNEVRYYNGRNADRIIKLFVDKKVEIPAELKGLTLLFLNRVQTLHDNERHWEETEEGNVLTDRGIEYIDRIVLDINKGKFDEDPFNMKIQPII